MSIPSWSCSVTMGAMVARACETSLQPRPAMEPESSMRRVVLKVVRNAYGSSAPAADVDGAGGAAAAGGGAALGESSS